MKIAFIDIALHLKTKSSNFFVKLLEKIGTVSEFHVNIYELSTVAEIAATDFDLIVLWQTEYFAPYFLSCGKKTIVIPMYDGCANSTSIYWQSMREARAVNFCQKLHHRHREAGLSSFYIQYFLDPSGIVPVTDFSSLRGFLWQRRPDHKIDWRLAYALLPQGMDSLHVHLVADVANDDPPPPPITISRWEANKNAYAMHLAKANVFFAPRPTEGIGMAKLEAMARGMCVIANNDATANEYLIDRQNGLLYSLPTTLGEAKPLGLSLQAAERMGRMARKSAEVGYERFLENVDGMLSHIATTPTPSHDYGKRADEEEFLRLARLFIENGGHYEQRLRHFRNRGAFVGDVRDMSLVDRIWHRLTGIRKYL